jgi:hypothetical protein
MLSFHCEDIPSRRITEGFGHYTSWQPFRKYIIYFTLSPYLAAGIAESVLQRAMGWTARARLPVEVTDFSPLQCPDRLWGPPSLSNGYRGSTGWGVELTTHLYLMLRSRIVEVYLRSHIRHQGQLHRYLSPHVTTQLAEMEDNWFRVWRDGSPCFLPRIQSYTKTESVSHRYTSVRAQEGLTHQSRSENIRSEETVYRLAHSFLPDDAFNGTRFEYSPEE